MMRLIRDLTIVTVLLGAGTWFLGWWTVPLIAAGAAAVNRSAGSILKVAVAATAAWALLLVLQAVSGSSVGQLGRDLGLSLGVPSSTPLILTLLLPAALAASAAGTVVGIARYRGSRLPHPTPE